MVRLFARRMEIGWDRLTFLRSQQSRSLSHRICYMRNILFLIALFIGSTGAAQRFELVDNSGRVSASVHIDLGRLLVNEVTGQQIQFTRDSRYDSLDRVWVGYYNSYLNRALLFPRSGRGALRYADFDDRVPRFVNSIRRVRPARRRPIPVLPPVLSGTGGFSGPYLPGANIYGPTIRPRPLQSVVIDSTTNPKPALAPVKVELLNSGPRPLIVTLVELQSNRSWQKTVPPSLAVAVTLKRDAGATRTETVRTVSPLGDSVTNERTSAVQPSVLYEIIVHERRIQSIAIDRTGKSPNVIEDMNFQGKGLGRFPIPPGEQLQAGRIDVYREAKNQGNAAFVAPITASEKESAPDPLEKVLGDVIKR